MPVTVAIPVSLRAARKRDSSAVLGEGRRRLSNVNAFGVKTKSVVLVPTNDIAHSRGKTRIAAQMVHS
jgi:hypothetical protein